MTTKDREITLKLKVQSVEPAGTDVMEGREIRPGFLNQKLDSLVSAMTDELRDAVDTSPETAQAGFRARGEPSGGPDPVNEPPRPNDGAETAIMSNADFSIEPGSDQTVRESGEVYAHAAWNVYGYVWFADGRFHEQVWRYHAPVAQFWADSLEDLMHLVNDAYGWD